MSNEDRGHSPADGPAKVKRKRNWNFVAEIEPYIDALEVLFQDCLAAYRNPWSQETGEGFVARARALGIELRSEYDESDNLLALSALLSLIPAEQVVQAMGEETRQKFLEHFADAILGKHCGPLTMVQALRDERDEALARAEKAETDAAASWQFAELARVKAKEAADRAFRASDRANSAERERDAMHAAAEELRAQGEGVAHHKFGPVTDRCLRCNCRRDGAENYTCNPITAEGEVPSGPPLDDTADEAQRSEPAAAVLTEAHSVSPSGECQKCNGTGRSCGNGRCDYQWCASCKACNGTGRKMEESDESHSAQDSEGVIQAHRMLANGQCAEGDNRQREGDLQELSEATRPVCIRWMGWEPTLTAVDLTELREAANKRREYLALAPDARSPLQEDLNNRAVLAAVEKLLSSGGTP